MGQKNLSHCHLAAPPERQKKTNQVDIVSYLRNAFHTFSRVYDTFGVWGSLFSFTTIYPEVVERHHIFAYYGAASRTMSPLRRVFLVPVHRTLSSLGAVTGLGIFWVLELKRAPHTPKTQLKLWEVFLGDDTSQHLS